jgi:hypothetical protein
MVGSGLGNRVGHAGRSELLPLRADSGPARSGTPLDGFVVWHAERPIAQAVSAFIKVLQTEAALLTGAEYLAMMHLSRYRTRDATGDPTESLACSI